MSYRGIVTPVGQGLFDITEYGIDEFRQSYGMPCIISVVHIFNSLEDRHVIRIATSDRLDMSRAFSREMESFALQLSVRTIQRRLQQHRL